MRAPRRRLLQALPALLGGPLVAGRARAAQTLRVAPGESLAAALRQARNGDTVLLLGGVHRAQAGVIEHARLRLRGEDGAVLLAEGAHAEGKALLVVRGGEVHIGGIEFRGARVPDGNGAGIRHERGRLVLQDCGFFDNELGLLTSNDGAAEIELERCRFAEVPRKATPGYTHLLYVGRIARARVAHCHFGAGRHGHLLKSRARENLIVANRLGTVAGGGGEASYEVDLPEGGLAEVRGNVLVQGPAGGNAVMLAFGAEGEGGAPRPHRLQLLGNSFVQLAGGAGRAVRVHADRLASAVAVDARDNLYLGALQVAPPFDDAAAGNRRAPLAAADIADGRFTLRGRAAPPGAQPD